jgi:GNAT superfamily N-acetyltransferase
MQVDQDLKRVLCVVILTEPMPERSTLINNSGRKLQKGFRVEAIEDADIDRILKMCAKLFTEAVNADYPELFFYCFADFSISKKAVLDGKIIGCYLLNEEPIHYYKIESLEELDRYRARKSLHGVALGILEEFRGLSYGRQLRDSVQLSNDYDYIWGFHVKTLNNLDNWIGCGRRLVGEMGGSYVTLMDLKGNTDTPE